MSGIKEWSREREAQIKKTTEILEDNIRLFTKNNNEVFTAIQNLAQAIEQISNDIMKINISKDILIKQLEAPVVELKTFLQNFVTIFSDRFEEINASSSGLVNFIEKENSFANTVIRLEENTAQQTTMSKQMIVELTNHLESFGNFVDREEKRLEVQTNAMVDQIKSLTSTYDNLTSKAEKKQERYHEALESQFNIKDNSLAKTVGNLADHSQQLISISKENMKALANNIDGFGKMVDSQYERLNNDITTSQSRYYKIAVIYKKLAQNTIAIQQHIESNVEELNNKLKESYTSLGSLVDSQKETLIKGFQKSQQSNIETASIKKAPHRKGMAMFFRRKK